MYKIPSIIGMLALAGLTGCAPAPVPDVDIILQEEVSSSSSGSNTRSIAKLSWIEYYDLEPFAVGDSKYGMIVTGIDPLTLEGHPTLKGRLEWQEPYGSPQLVFIPDVDSSQHIKHEDGTSLNAYFYVQGNIQIPEGKGAIVNAQIEAMNFVICECNKPSTVTIRSYEMIGNFYDITQKYNP